MRGRAKCTTNLAQNRSELSRRPRRQERESVHQGRANRLARSRRNIRYPRDWQPSNNIPESGKSHKKKGLNGEERNIAFRSSLLHIQQAEYGPIFDLPGAFNHPVKYDPNFRSAPGVSLPARQSWSTEPSLPSPRHWQALATIPSACVCHSWV
jgi:hypothetical protein